MKNFLASFLLIIAYVTVIAQSSAITAPLEKDIETHFKQYQPELYRYSGLTTYGEIMVTFRKEQIEKELQLFDRIKASELITKPTGNVFALCHNIIIHSPDQGKEFLQLLNNPTNEEQTLALILKSDCAGDSPQSNAT